MTFLDRSDLVGSHPQPFRYYFTLAVGTFRTGLDVAMLVVGTGLVGLAVTVLLAGFEVVDLDTDAGIGGTLGSALVIGVCGGFALGVASEGRYGMARSLEGFPSLEVALGRIVAIIAMAFALLYTAGRLELLVADLPYPFTVGVEVVRSVGSTGFGAALVGVPAAWAVKRGLDRVGWGAGLVIPTIYLIWLIFAVVAFEVP